MRGVIFTDKNFKLLGASIVLLIVGYLLLGQGPVYNPLSWSYAPLILVGVYCVLIPIAILKKGSKEEDKDNQGV